MPSSYTPNYNLNQWEASDRVLRTDFNADNAKIDAAIAAEAEARTAADAAHQAVLEDHTALLAKRGNCQIYTVDYTGTGTHGRKNPNSLTFPKKPVWVTIIKSEGRSFFNIFPQDISYGYGSATADYTVNITWDGNTVSWYANDESVQMNYKSGIYHVFAFCPMD